VDYGSPSPAPFAFFDRTSRSWRTWPPSARGASVPFSGNWPPAGTTRRGCAYAHPISAHRTKESECFCSLLPTPTVSESTGTVNRGRNGGKSLRGTVALLPTPAACNANDSERVQSWLARQDRRRERRTPPLSVAVRLLPTPRASDTGTIGRRGGKGFGPPLSAVLLPTPRASDATKGSPNQRGSRGDLTLPSAAARIGARTNRRSAAGRRSSTAQRPTRQNPDDADNRA
jgi:hypothetical protein